MTPDYLFVYGTLMRKYPQNPLGEVLKRNTKFIGEAFTYGKLYLVDYYPGLLPNSIGENHKTYGELVEIEEKSDLYEQLDEYEDYLPQDLSKSLYIRKLTDCYLIENNKLISAQTYFYNQEVGQFRWIRGGRFLEV
jgi:gamma-glutamylcyclotransferase (GGCT)/AIG2-like uncharacterized protein YtfP